MWRVAQAFKPVLSSSSPAFKEDNTGLKACTTKFQFLCGLQRFVGSKVGQPILAAAGFSAGFPGPVEVVCAGVYTPLFNIGRGVDSPEWIADHIRTLIVAGSRSRADAGVIAGGVDLERRSALR